MTNAAALKTDVTTTVADVYFNNDEIFFPSQNAGVIIGYDIPRNSIDLVLNFKALNILMH